MGNDSTEHLNNDEFAKAFKRQIHKSGISERSRKALCVDCGKPEDGHDKDGKCLNPPLDKPIKTAERIPVRKKETPRELALRRMQDALARGGVAGMIGATRRRIDATKNLTKLAGISMAIQEVLGSIPPFSSLKLTPQERSQLIEMKMGLS